MKNAAKAYSILIVDDEVELCEAVASAFELKGHNVQKASNGNKAIQIVQKDKVDLVLSDIRMSEGDGIQLLSYIKGMNINRPLVALMTGYADVTRDEMYEMGAEAVFEKPFKVMEIIKQLTKTLDSRDKRWKEKPNILPVFKIKRSAVKDSEFKLGRGGFYIQIETEEPKVGQFIEFEIGFGEDALQGFGLIRWVRREAKTTCGVEFVYLEEPMRTKVLEMIDTSKARTYIPRG